jgi:hypothetical protein
MSTTVTDVRPRRWAAVAGSQAARERTTRRRVGLAWGLLVLNAMTFYGSALHIPSAVGKLITQGALPLALIVALSANRRLIVRPNVFCCLVTLLVAEAFLTTLQPQHFGTIYRTFRFAEFTVGLWLLTPWWGRRDLLLVRCHLIALTAALGSVVLGLLIMPGRALSGGRLGGVLWDIPATEVAHYSAVIAGSMVVLWLGGMVRSRLTLYAAVAGIAMILLSHTRTALVAMVAALLIAGLNLIMARARVRRFFASAGVIVSIGIMTAGSVAATWLARGQNAQELASLTGRTDFWSMVLNLPRDKFQEIFGFGLSNGSVNGLPIDSSWLVAYLEQGLFGVVVCVIILLFLLVAAFFQHASTRRALALFLITYSLIASFTQVGFVNPTTYLLELTLAASLLMPPAAASPTS